MTIFTPTEVIGHRGAGRSTDSGPAQNTVASFHTAVDSGAGWIEVDVRRSADGVLVLNHDPTLPDGRAIVDLTAETCRKEGLTTLQEATAEIPPHIGLDIDLKTVMEDATGAADQRTAALLLPVLRREARRRRVFVCSFDPGALLELHRGAPHVPTAWMPYVRNPVDEAVSGAAGLGCAIVAIDARSFGVGEEGRPPGRREVDYTVATAHAAGLEVLSWCPDPEEAARFAAVGMDAVVVDDVPGAVAALDAR
ncbi:glycerophosphoryl diester phosphodiesterase [Haloactinospora alba]|uniref:Glycerophosphoryl diester phosphodiesterase n=1 Tax=Haloactinospora alba TaxID=405555 RepID=A0A543NEV3_9ACTN|nr:glycerophosphodiester phosphodiesterase [Haloactinospora alba]TQN30377.1 glycerophosphoryl diester phosphodiesterase [Haloactinospora alba]